MKPQTVFQPADILLPKEGNLTQWSVVACDQYTSQPEYWEEAEKIVTVADAIDLIQRVVE